LPAFSAEGNHAANLGGSNLLISAKTKNPDVAVDFAKFAMTNTDALNVGMNLGLFPSYTPYYSNSLTTQPLDFFGGEKVFKMAANEVNQIPPSYHTSDFTTAATDVQTAIGNVMTDKAQPQDALNQAANQLAQSTGRKVAQ
jgi:lactose/L-arabinose transport system substrate-binding protein